MKLNRLERKPWIGEDKVLMAKYINIDKLISELEKKEAPAAVVDEINKYVGEINSFSGTNKDLLKQIKKSQIGLLKLIEKELKLVTKNHHRNIWTVMGMSAFGLPIGSAIGLTLGNIGLLAIGLPIGMGIGVAVGASLDKKAQKSGLQLDVEMK